MNTSSIIAWEDRLTRFSLAILFGATAYGIVVGAMITMYYDLTPNMGSLEDNLAPAQLVLYLLAVIVSLFHLPLALSDIKRALWQQATIRAVACIGPLVIFLGTEGLISHFLWWLPISETDRFHMLHHTVFAGLPLTLGYWLVLRWGWRPAAFQTAAALSRRVWLVSGIVLVWMVMSMGIMFGFVSPLVFGATMLGGLVALPIIFLVKA